MIQSLLIMIDYCVIFLLINLKQKDGSKNDQRV